jgi:hypothetical protein
MDGAERGGRWRSPVPAPHLAPPTKCSTPPPAWLASPGENEHLKWTFVTWEYATQALRFVSPAWVAHGRRGVLIDVSRTAQSSV